ncbi:MAG: hypothetical protein WBK10_00405 [Bacillota bacterium]|jgi:hypothetical protein
MEVLNDDALRPFHVWGRRYHAGPVRAPVVETIVPLVVEAYNTLVVVAFPVG